MTLRLTPETLAAAYDYLRTTPPFDRWNLPESEEVTFRVTRSKDTCGHYWFTAPNGHQIDISLRLNRTTAGMLSTMAHEMVHLFQANSCMRLSHDDAFHKLADQVCKLHGFDRGVF